MTTATRLLILIMTTACLSIAACKHSNTDVVPSPPPPAGGGNDTTNNGNPNPADTALCFERDILPIFISNCAKSGCHDAISKQDGYQFTSYQTITSKKFKRGDPNDTELFEKITENDPDDVMPPPPNAKLTSTQITKIYNWIALGAPNTTGCATGCDSNKYTFAATVQPMLSQYCKGCHNATSVSGGVNLDNYSSVKIVANDHRLINVIKHTTGYPQMPKGGNKLSDCQIKQIEKWIANGAANN